MKQSAPFGLRKKDELQISRIIHLPNTALSTYGMSVLILSISIITMMYSTAAISNVDPVYAISASNSTSNASNPLFTDPISCFLIPCAAPAGPTSSVPLTGNTTAIIGISFKLDDQTLQDLQNNRTEIKEIVTGYVNKSMDEVIKGRVTPGTTSLKWFDRDLGTSGIVVCFRAPCP